MATYERKRPYRTMNQHVEDAQYLIGVYRHIRNMIDQGLEDEEQGIATMLTAIHGAMQSLQRANLEAHRIANRVKYNSTRWSMSHGRRIDDVG